MVFFGKGTGALVTPRLSRASIVRARPGAERIKCAGLGMCRKTEAIELVVLESHPPLAGAGLSA